MAIARAAVRDPIRKEVSLRPGEFRGRNGEVLRFRSNGGDQFDIPEDLKEEGWTYQWCTATCYGEASNDLSTMYANGWRYVTPDSRVGKFFTVPGENADHILRGGLVLMERPHELTEMYLEETAEKTRFQYATLMDKSSDMPVPDGFDNRGKRVTREVAQVRSRDLPDDLRSGPASTFELPDEE